MQRLSGALASWMLVAHLVDADEVTCEQVFMWMDSEANTEGDDCPAGRKSDVDDVTCIGDDEGADGCGAKCCVAMTYTCQQMADMIDADSEVDDCDNGRKDPLPSGTCSTGDECEELCCQAASSSSSDNNSTNKSSDARAPFTLFAAATAVGVTALTC